MPNTTWMSTSTTTTTTTALGLALAMSTLSLIYVARAFCTLAKTRWNRVIIKCHSWHASPGQLSCLDWGFTWPDAMASHNTHDKCLIYFALKPHLSCLIACATTLKIYLPHHTPHIQQCMKKTGKKETDSGRKRKGNKKQHTHTHHKMLSSICVLRSVRHAPNLCAFNCKRPLVTPFFVVPHWVVVVAVVLVVFVVVVAGMSMSCACFIVCGLY